MKKAGLWKDHGLVFPSTVGRPLSLRADTVQQDLRNVIRERLLSDDKMTLKKVVHFAATAPEGSIRFHDLEAL